VVGKVFGTKIAESKFKCTTGILTTRGNISGHEKVKKYRYSGYRRSS